MVLMEINLGVVRVKLTECGRKMLAAKGDHPRTEDVNGWSEWYFWDLMSVFGSKYRPGDELPFEFTMLAEGAEPPPSPPAPCVTEGGSEPRHSPQ